MRKRIDWEDVIMKGCFAFLVGLLAFLLVLLVVAIRNDLWASGLEYREADAVVVSAKSYEEVITRPLYINNRFVGFSPAGTEEGVRLTVETEDGTRYEIETESGFVCEKGDSLLIEIGFEDGEPTDVARLKEKQAE